jgi:hypothetical protein
MPVRLFIHLRTRQSNDQVRKKHTHKSKTRSKQKTKQSSAVYIIMPILNTVVV